MLLSPSADGLLGVSAPQSALHVPARPQVSAVSAPDPRERQHRRVRRRERVRDLPYEAGDAALGLEPREDAHVLKKEACT